MHSFLTCWLAPRTQHRQQLEHVQCCLHEPTAPCAVHMAWHPAEAAAHGRRADTSISGTGCCGAQGNTDNSSSSKQLQSKLTFGASLRGSSSASTMPDASSSRRNPGRPACKAPCSSSMMLGCRSWPPPECTGMS